MAKAESSSRKTIFVVQPFEMASGVVLPGQAYEVPTSNMALKKAEALNERVVGGIAFSRTGDPASGEFDDAVILGMFGSIPDEALDAIRDGIA